MSSRTQFHGIRCHENLGLQRQFIARLCDGAVVGGYVGSADYNSALRRTSHSTVKRIHPVLSLFQIAVAIIMGHMI